MKQKTAERLDANIARCEERLNMRTAKDFIKFVKHQRDSMPVIIACDYEEVVMQTPVQHKILLQTTVKIRFHEVKTAKEHYGE